MGTGVRPDMVNEENQVELMRARDRNAKLRALHFAVGELAFGPFCQVTRSARSFGQHDLTCKARLMRMLPLQAIATPMNEEVKTPPTML